MKTMYAVVMITEIDGYEVIQNIIGMFKEEATAQKFAETNSNIWNHYCVKEVKTDL
jgi:hypothetical protein